MSYSFDKNAPAIIEPTHYRRVLHDEFNKLLREKANDETAFQDFFERNPCMVPGALSELDFGPSGHGPERQALITQPKIRGIINRRPDFMWLSYDSMTFSPVLIEIEAPSKKYFNKDGTTTKDFSKAKNQLDEWAMILNRPENILAFYNDFDISKDLRRAIFKPYYLLIFGRREEYENDPIRKNKRMSLVDSGSRQYLMSYDRIQPTHLVNSYVTCTVKDGKFIAKYISPTMKLGPLEGHLLEIGNIIEAVDDMNYTTIERKSFLKIRIPYWVGKIKERKKRSVTLPTVAFSKQMQNE